LRRHFGRSSATEKKKKKKKLWSATHFSASLAGTGWHTANGRCPRITPVGLQPDIFLLR
jgi:hypothetical protein